MFNERLSEALDNMGIGLFLPKKDQCDTCCSYKAGHVSEVDYQNHLTKKNSARDEKTRDKCKAAAEECHVLTMDVEAVKVSPYLKASALYYKTKLMVHNFTTYDLKSNHAVCYWWDETEGDLSASSFASCLVNYINSYCGEDKFPVIVYSDGCTNQNRNAMMSTALLELGVSQKRVIMQKFLEKGHTQMECDSVHSAIEAQLKNKTINVPSDYVKICKDARWKNPYVTKYLNHDFFTDYSIKTN